MAESKGKHKVPHGKCQGPPMSMFYGHFQTSFWSVFNVIYILVRLPLALVAIIFGSPIALWNFHLPFHIVPWYLQLHWHVANLWHLFCMPGFEEWMHFCTNAFVPHLAANEENLYELFPGQPAPGVVGQHGEGLTATEVIDADDFIAMGVEGFKAKFGATNRPVQIKGFATKCGRIQNWSMDRFSKEYADTLVPSYTRHNDTEITVVKFGDLCEEIRKDGPIYGRAVTGIFTKSPHLKHEMPLHLYKHMRNTLHGDEFNEANLCMMFFSSKKTVTQIHADVTNNFNMQFEGKKEWWLFHPLMFMLSYMKRKGTNQYHQTQYDFSNIDHDKYPAVKYIQGHRFTMEPGDVLWLPSWYLHGIVNLSTPSCAAVSDGVGDIFDLLKMNLVGSVAMFLNPWNMLDAIEAGERARRRWLL